MDGAMVAETGLGATPRRMPFGLAGSVVFHAGLLAALFLLTPLRSFVAPEPQPISVDLIPLTGLDPAPPVEAPAPPELAAPSTDLPATDAVPQRAAPASPGAPALNADGSFRATRLYAATLLTRPAMASVRRGMTTLASSEKLMQLCNIEALEQIRLAASQYDPDTLVSYAMADPVTSGLMLTAMGGAFRSRRQWYNVSFECVVAPALDGVTAFSFKLGDAIPRSEWEAHYLTAEDEDE